MKTTSNLIGRISLTLSPRSNLDSCLKDHISLPKVPQILQMEQNCSPHPQRWRSTSCTWLSSYGRTRSWGWSWTRWVLMLMKFGCIVSRSISQTLTEIWKSPGYTQPTVCTWRPNSIQRLFILSCPIWKIHRWNSRKSSLDFMESLHCMLLL